MKNISRNCGILLALLVSIFFLYSCGKVVEELPEEDITPDTLPADESQINASEGPSISLENYIYEEDYLTDDNKYTNVKECDSPKTSTTHPNKPCISGEIDISSDQMGLNLFEWRKDIWRVFNQKNQKTENIYNPFYTYNNRFPFVGDRYVAKDRSIQINDQEQGISSVKLSEGSTLPDFMPESGWELVKANLGFTYLYRNGKYEIYKNDLTQGIPHLILYNRFDGKLRIIARYNNAALNYIKTCLKISEYSASGDLLSGSNFLNFTNAQQNGGVKTNRSEEQCSISYTSSLDNFIYADFYLRYDVCTPYHRRELILSFQPFAYDELEIAGREIGSITNIKDTAIDNKFLSGFKSRNTGSALDATGIYTYDNLETLKEVYKNYEYKIEGYLSGSDPGKERASRLLLKGVGELADLTDYKPFSKFSKALGEFVLAGSLFDSKAPKLYSNLTLPNPMPMVAHSELYLKGKNMRYQNKTSFQYVLPGSKDQKKHSSDYDLKKALSTAYVNPMGSIDILRTPKVKFTFFALPLVTRKIYLGNLYTAIVDESNNGGWYSSRFPWPEYKYSTTVFQRGYIKSSVMLSNLDILPNPYSGIADEIKLKAFVEIRFDWPKYKKLMRIPDDKISKTITNKSELYFYRDDSKNSTKYHYPDFSDFDTYYVYSNQFRSSAGGPNHEYFSENRWLSFEYNPDLNLPDLRTYEYPDALDKLELVNSVGANVELTLKDDEPNKKSYITNEPIYIDQLDQYKFNIDLADIYSCVNFCYANLETVKQHIQIIYHVDSSSNNTITDKILTIPMNHTLFQKLPPLWAEKTSASDEIPNYFLEYSAEKLKNNETLQAEYCSSNYYQAKMFQ